MIDCWHGPFTRASHAAFVADFWQKKPLLIRGFLSAADLDSYCPLSMEDLVDLACEPSSPPPRLIRERGGAEPWECRKGPFDAIDLDALPQNSLPWTLLVPYVDQRVEQVERLREAPLWAFTPRWRLQDVQVSYAPPGGSVGAHVDNFDVVLLQGRGVREWSLEIEPRSALEEALVPGLQTRVLRCFEPSHRYKLEPGDALYLPPRIPHHGVSMSHDCLTYSIGFRAPSRAELLRSFAEHVARQSTEDERYVDDEDELSACLAREAREGTTRRAAVSVGTSTRLRAQLRHSLLGALADDESFEAWVGGVLSGGATLPAASPLGSSAGVPDGISKGSSNVAGSDLSRTVSSAVGSSSLETDAMAGGPAELGPAGRAAMEAWIKETERADGSRKRVGRSEDQQEVDAMELSATDDDDLEGYEDDEDGEEAALLASLEAELAATCSGNEADVDSRELSSPIAGEGEDSDPLASATALVAAIASSAPGAPSALRHAEDVTIACVEHARGGLSVFINGERLGGLRDGEHKSDGGVARDGGGEERGASHREECTKGDDAVGDADAGDAATSSTRRVAEQAVHALCSSSFVRVGSELRAALRESAEVRVLIERMLEADVLYVDLEGEQ